MPDRSVTASEALLVKTANEATITSKSSTDCSKPKSSFAVFKIRENAASVLETVDDISLDAIVTVPQHPAAHVHESRYTFVVYEVISKCSDFLIIVIECFDGQPISLRTIMNRKYFRKTHDFPCKNVN